MPTQLLQILFMINMLMENISTQYYANPYYQNMPQAKYEVQSDMDYETETIRYRRGGYEREYGSSGGRLPVDEDEGYDSEECKCSCKECNNPKPCCRAACSSCPDAQGSPGFVFIPYPYPLMLPNMMNDSTTTKTLTTLKTTPSDANAEDVNNIRTSQNTNERKYMLTSFRKTKPTWEPKYGIVPIPDTLAENLMSQLRNVKELQARRH